MGTEKVVKQLQDIKTLPIGELRDAALQYLDLDRKSSMQAWVNLERFECKEQIGDYWGAFGLLTETLVFFNEKPELFTDEVKLRLLLALNKGVGIVARKPSISCTIGNTLLARYKQLWAESDYSPKQTLRADLTWQYGKGLGFDNELFEQYLESTDENFYSDHDSEFAFQAWWLLAQERFEEAREYMAFAPAKIIETSAGYFFDLSYVQLRLGEAERARMLFDRGIRLLSDSSSEAERMQLLSKQLRILGAGGCAEEVLALLRLNSELLLSNREDMISFEFFLEATVALTALCESDEKFASSRSRVGEWWDTSVSDLRNIVVNRAEEVAELFDERNGNDYFLTLLISKLDAAGIVPRPLPAVIIPRRTGSSEESEDWVFASASATPAIALNKFVDVEEGDRSNFDLPMLDVEPLKPRLGESEKGYRERVLSRSNWFNIHTVGAEGLLQREMVLRAAVASDYLEGFNLDVALNLLFASRFAMWHLRGETAYNEAFIACDSILRLDGDFGLPGVIGSCLNILVSAAVATGRQEEAIAALKTWQNRYGHLITYYECLLAEEKLLLSMPEEVRSSGGSNYDIAQRLEQMLEDSYSAEMWYEVSLVLCSSKLRRNGSMRTLNLLYEFESYGPDLKSQQRVAVAEKLIPELKAERNWWEVNRVVDVCLKH